MPRNEACFRGSRQTEVVMHCANCEEYTNECFRLRAFGAFSVRTDIYRAASTSPPPPPSLGPTDVMRQAVIVKQACLLGLSLGSRCCCRLLGERDVMSASCYVFVLPVISRYISFLFIKSNYHSATLQG